MFLSDSPPRSSKARLQPASDGIMHVTRNHDAARRRFGFQPRRYVHAIAVEIVAIHDQVAEMQTDSEHDAGVLRLVWLASAMACWNSMAAPSASTALGNSASAPSPVSLTSRPP